MLLKDTDLCIVVGLTVDITVLGDFELDGEVVDLLVELNIAEVVVDMFTVGELFGDIVDGTFAEVVVMVVLTLDGTVLVFVVAIVEDVVLKMSVVDLDVGKIRSVEIMSEEGVDNSDVEKIRSVEVKLSVVAL